MGLHRPIPCQRLSSAGRGGQFFEVQFDAQIDAQRPTTSDSHNPTASAREVMTFESQELEDKQQHAGSVFVATSSANEVSPWLQLTSWVGHLNGCTLGDVA